MRTATPLDQPRAIGFARVSSKQVNEGSGIDGLRQSGALKLLFPRSRETLHATLINTAGGVTGGDRFEVNACAGRQSQLTMTTQAAERAYGAQMGQTGVINTTLTADAGSRLFWLPQETILYKDAAIARRLHVDLAAGAEFLMVEPVLFGRRAMGEDVTTLAFRDRIDIRRDGQPIYRDGVDLHGDVAAQLDQPAIGAGARAMASLVWVSRDAPGRLDALRRIIGTTGGASLLQKDVLVMRLLARDGYILRRALIPVLDLITDDTLPQSWRL